MRRTNLLLASIITTLILWNVNTTAYGYVITYSNSTVRMFWDDGLMSGGKAYWDNHFRLTTWTGVNVAVSYDGIGGYEITSVTSPTMGSTTHLEQFWGGAPRIKGNIGERSDYASRGTITGNTATGRVGLQTYQDGFNQGPLYKYDNGGGPYRCDTITDGKFKSGDKYILQQDIAGTITNPTSGWTLWVVLAYRNNVPASWKTDITFGEPDAVPEPTTLSLLAIGGMAILRRKRNRMEEKQ